MSVDCDEENLETDSSLSQNDRSPLSLLNFADMALALEAHKHEKDHTYAMNDSLEIELSDSERLLQKEKDHNYSYFSKTLLSRGRASNFPQFRTEPRRSSSEENLNRATASSDRICSQDFPVSFVTRKSHSLEKMTSQQSELADFLCQSGFPGFNGLVVSSEENILDEKVLGSSWPKETTLETFRKRDSLPKSQMNSPPSYCDHTYARELSIQKNLCKIRNCPNVINDKMPLKTDHTYFDFSQRHMCGCGSKIKKTFKIDSDHNYTASGNVNELNSPWIPLRRDHTYSIF